MDWFGGSSDSYKFTMFSTTHIIVLVTLIAASYAMFLLRNRFPETRQRKLEVGFAFSLIVMESLYHVWMVANGFWRSFDSLPAGLCSISLILAIILLLTGKKVVYDILLYTGLLGATQALATPYLFYDFPHFRFIHFFYTHMMMVLVPLYFTWVKGYRPTIRSVFRLIIFLNLLMPVVMLINKLTGGNYMYLSHKPETASLLDVLGPYPWYILSLEGLLVSLSLLLWLIFRQKGNKATVHASKRNEAGDGSSASKLEKVKT
ncbi:TIGR02206 family membrane protein [Neobacillus notoginsengisoli]|uniref:TIGR02206 family membrane protein n=1 Tax=Neobacillus notoginsengisoli TaxID=1578198 RepID=A0A417YPT3_9BACI|nr:TIGR02206 family membrane protein [Neobacillus notoginsengisoli]RHW35689.1 TIGR02206 family membrane protein [Neobacillus notoginsengisoli]